MNKPVIGISCGDLNGIGTEIIIKTFADHRVLEQCTPVIFASNKLINFYRKSLPEANLVYQSIKDFTRLNPKQVNVFNCWEEEVAITPGQLTETGGRYAVLSLQAALQAVKEGHLHGLVTAPIHKSNVQSAARLARRGMRRSNLRCSGVNRIANVTPQNTAPRNCQRMAPKATVTTASSNKKALDSRWSTGVMGGAGDGYWNVSEPRQCRHGDTGAGAGKACRLGGGRFGGTIGAATPGPSPATVASANRFSRVAEGFSTS